MTTPTIEQEVKRAAKLLARLIRVAGLTRAQVDQLLGEGRGFATRVLNGIVGLKHEHILALLSAIGVDPGDYFRVLYPRPEDRTSGGPLARLLEQIQTTEEAPEEPPPPAAASPAAPLDPDDLAQRIAALVRENLRKTPRGKKS
ncbi:MAG TPA: hypothetical protein VFE33_32465 [Thermoanaerobaculia bacterium]|nr:hypothetical protein [Thermoanaerobaculia bacterium]